MLKCKRFVLSRSLSVCKSCSLQLYLSTGFVHSKHSIHILNIRKHIPFHRMQVLSSENGNVVSTWFSSYGKDATKLMWALTEMQIVQCALYDMHRMQSKKSCKHSYLITVTIAFKIKLFIACWRWIGVAMDLFINKSALKKEII